jgi:hypothetical protein
MEDYMQFLNSKYSNKLPGEEQEVEVEFKK